MRRNESVQDQFLCFSMLSGLFASESFGRESNIKNVFFGCGSPSKNYDATRTYFFLFSLNLTAQYFTPSSLSLVSMESCRFKPYGTDENREDSFCLGSLLFYVSYTSKNILDLISHYFLVLYLLANPGYRVINIALLLFLFASYFVYRH